MREGPGCSLVIYLYFNFFLHRVHWPRVLFLERKQGTCSNNREKKTRDGDRERGR